MLKWVSRRQLSLVSEHPKGRRRMNNARTLELAATVAGLLILCGSVQAQNVMSLALPASGSGTRCRNRTGRHTDAQYLA